jgi:hypothetical protein
VVLPGGTAGIGPGRLARAAGARLVLTGRDHRRLREAAREVEARRGELRARLPIGRVVQPSDVADGGHAVRRGHRRPVSGQPRSGRNAARTSDANSSGSSQAAKWPPLSTWLK